MGITKFQARLILPTFCISFLIAHSGFLTLDLGNSVAAQTSRPVMLEPNLAIRVTANNFVTPIAIAFLGANDGMLVLEKNTGRVHRVNGTVQSTVLDLGVNSASERGLLGIATHPNFPSNPGVYLFWTCRANVGQDDNPFRFEQRECADAPTMGPDTDNELDVPLLGNRVDRFIWNGSQLTFDRNLIKLLAFQHDAAPEPPGQGDQAQPIRANHDGGVLAFGPDGKLYVMIGDVGRRGQLQNLRLRSDGNRTGSGGGRRSVRRPASRTRRISRA